MEQAAVEGLELAYELRGSGDPVVLIHWGVGVEWAEPLLAEPALAARHRLLTYHRVGYGDSTRVAGRLDVADHARHCRSLLRHLGIERAHVVGHSSSAVVALQLALDFPEAVQTLALLEAARPAPPTEAQDDFLRTFVAPAVARFRDGDRAGAVDTFFSGVFGTGYRPALDEALPRAFEEAVSAADAFFTQELPALQAWRFTEEDGSRIRQPALVVLGEHSAPTFAERRELLLSWLPNAEPFELGGATHLLHARNARGMAEGLAAFFARHPLP